MRSYKKTALAVLGLSAALSGSAAWADTLTGTSVSYSFDNAELGLFGTAALSGDSLVFTADPSFKAESINGSASFVPWTVHVTVSANPGYQLSSFSLTESGSYSLSGSLASVGVTGEFGVLDKEGSTGNYIPATIVETAPFDGTTSNWTAQAGVALPATGWGGLDGVVGSVSLTISNQLYAYTGLDSAASITKQFVNVSSVASPVPEAQPYALMLAGLGLVGFMARRATRTPV